MLGELTGPFKENEGQNVMWRGGPKERELGPEPEAWIQVPTWPVSRPANHTFSAEIEGKALQNDYTCQVIMITLCYDCVCVRGGVDETEGGRLQREATVWSKEDRGTEISSTLCCRSEVVVKRPHFTDKAAEITPGGMSCPLLAECI